MMKTSSNIETEGTHLNIIKTRRMTNPPPASFTAGRATSAPLKVRSETGTSASTSLTPQSTGSPAAAVRREEVTESIPKKF